jgi:hypothetical protein
MLPVVRIKKQENKKAANGAKEKAQGRGKKAAKQ